MMIHERTVRTCGEKAWNYSRIMIITEPGNCVKKCV